MAKPRLRHIIDDEESVHFVGAAQAVNVGLCGFNGDGEDTDEPVTCLGCLATIRHIHSHQREDV